MECLKIEEMIHLIVPFAHILKHGLINRAAVAPNLIHFLTVMGTILRFRFSGCLFVEWFTSLSKTSKTSKTV